MAKKKPTKKVTKKVTKSNKKSYGELFDKHPNLIWLMPIFLIVAALAVVVVWNQYNVPVENLVMEEKVMLDATLEDTTEATGDLMIEEDN